MPESSERTTSNGYEIRHTREALGFTELQDMLAEYGLSGSSPAERLDSLRQRSAQDIALFMADVNKRLQGSDESLVHEDTMRIDDRKAMHPSDRYDVFTDTIDKIKESQEGINPARVGDVLALTAVLLHPFKDGNGRTARMMGFIFRDDFDASDASETFTALAESRDLARERGGFMIYGYIPYVGEGLDQSDPQVVSEYVGKILSESENNQLYTGPYGQADLQPAPTESLVS